MTQIIAMYLTFIVPTWLKGLYWISGTLSFLAGMHVMLHTTFCMVFGQGKALYGRVGAVKEVVMGYREEQDGVLYGFVFMLFTFGMLVYLYQLH